MTSGWQGRRAALRWRKWTTSSSSVGKNLKPGGRLTLLFLLSPISISNQRRLMSKQRGWVTEINYWKLALSVTIYSRIKGGRRWRERKGLTWERRWFDHKHEGETWVWVGVLQGRRVVTERLDAFISNRLLQLFFNIFSMCIC